MKATAASSAALAVANGFVSDVHTGKEYSEAETDDSEKNWTRMLNTDDQEVLMEAHEALKKEMLALAKFQQTQLDIVTGL